MQKNLKIFSGSEHVEFTKLICKHLNLQEGNICRHVFPSNERYVQFHENIRGCDVFLVSCKDTITNNANDSLMELLIMADAARRASAGRITAVIPFFYYSRQDRKEKSRVPITSKLVLDLIEASGIDRVVTMDLHSPQVGGFTNLPFDHLTFEPVLSNWIKEKYNNLTLRDSVILMAPDVGAVKRVEKYATTLGTDFGFISKKRIGDDKVELQNIVGDVQNKNVIIIDDLTESCGTMIQAAKACKHNGACNVTCAVTHGAFTSTGIERLRETTSIDHLVHSNTVSHIWNTVMDLRVAPRSITQLDVSMLFAKAINCIHNNESISELFV